MIKKKCQSKILHKLLIKKICPKGLYQLAFPPAMQECFLYPTSSPAKVVISVFYLGHYYRYKTESQSCFDLHFSDS